jgi:hypothetical protein
MNIYNNNLIYLETYLCIFTNIFIQTVLNNVYYGRAIYIHSGRKVPFLHSTSAVFSNIYSLSTFF